MGRAGRVLQAEGHDHGAGDARGKILNVEVRKGAEKFLPADAQIVGLFKDLVHGPVHNAGVVRIISQEGNGRGRHLDARVRGGCYEGESASLAFAKGHNPVRIGLLQRGGKVYRAFDVAEGAAVVVGFFVGQALANPSFFGFLEDTLAADAYQDVYAVRIGRGVKAEVRGAVSHVLEVHRVFAGGVGNADGTARGFAAQGLVKHVEGAPEFVGVLGDFHPLRFHGNGFQFGKGALPEGIEVRTGVGGTHHGIRPYADVKAHGIPQAHLVEAGLQGAQFHAEGAVGPYGGIGRKNHFRLSHQGTVRHQAEAGGAGSGVHLGGQRVGCFSQEKPSVVRYAASGGGFNRCCTGGQRCANEADKEKFGAHNE